jgi:L-rhamnose mutarotase
MGKLIGESNFPGGRVLFHVCLITAYSIYLARRPLFQIWTGHDMEGDTHGMIVGAVFD